MNRTRQPTGAIVIRAIGMTTSLGPTAGASCAAARAGVSRARAVEHAVFAAVEGEMAATHACFAGRADTGFAGPGRLRDLTRGALADLETRLEPAALRGERIRVFVVAPAREHEAQRIAPMCETAGAYRDALVAMHTANLQATLTADRRAIAAALADAAWLGGAAIDEWFTGRLGFAAALRTAKAAIDGESATTCLLVAVDSLLDDETLDALFAADLLRTPDNANGLIPGEAAVAMLLARASAAPGHGPHPVTIDHVGLESVASREPSLHDDARLLAAVVAQCGVQADEPVEFLADVNGDVRRAAEWGCAQVLPGWPRRGHTTFPIGAFGDTGSAAGAIATAVAAHDWARGAPRARTTIVTLSEPGGGKAAIRLSPLSAPPTR